MARESGVSTKTIRRDLELFQHLALAMEERTEERGRKRWKLSEQCVAAPVTFTFEEALALYLSRDLLDPLAGTVQGDACQSAFSKIRSALNDHAIDYLERLADRICSLSHKEIRHFKVDRIHDLEISQLPFQRPAEFDVRTHLRGLIRCLS